MIDEVSLTVDRADLDRVLTAADGADTDVEWWEAVARIRAAIPERPWEPSEAMVGAWMSSFFLSTAHQARKGLIALHDAGFDLTLREGE